MIADDLEDMRSCSFLVLLIRREDDMGSAISALQRE